MNPVKCAISFSTPIVLYIRRQVAEQGHAISYQLLYLFIDYQDTKISYFFYELNQSHYTPTKLVLKSTLEILTVYQIVSHGGGRS